MPTSRKMRKDGKVVYIPKSESEASLSGKTKGKEAKVIGKVRMGNGVQDVYNKMPEGWKVQDAQTTPYGYIFVTNGVSIFQNLRGENKGKRKTGLIKDYVIWNDKSEKRKIKPMD